MPQFGAFFIVNLKLWTLVSRTFPLFNFFADLSHIMA